MTTHEGSYWLPAYRIDVADTVGCGDSFAAAVVLGFIRGEGGPTVSLLKVWTKPVLTTVTALMPECFDPPAKRTRLFPSYHTMLLRVFDAQSCICRASSSDFLNRGPRLYRLIETL